jgi:hypothetical protein
VGAGARSFGEGTLTRPVETTDRGPIEIHGSELRRVGAWTVTHVVAIEGWLAAPAEGGDARAQRAWCIGRRAPPRAHDAARDGRGVGNADGDRRAARPARHGRSPRPARLDERRAGSRAARVHRPDGDRRAALARPARSASDGGRSSTTFVRPASPRCRSRACSSS